MLGFHERFNNGITENKKTVEPSEKIKEILSTHMNNCLYQIYAPTWPASTYLTVNPGHISSNLEVPCLGT